MLTKKKGEKIINAQSIIHVNMALVTRTMYYYYSTNRYVLPNMY